MEPVFQLSRVFIERYGRGNPAVIETGGFGQRPDHPGIFRNIPHK
jgi:hypothetical protein